MFVYQSILQRLWRPHLDLSRCPLPHKSLLLLMDCKGSDTTWEFRMWRPWSSIPHDFVHILPLLDVERIINWISLLTIKPAKIILCESNLSTALPHSSWVSLGLSLSVHTCGFESLPSHTRPLCLPTYSTLCKKATIYQVTIMVAISKSFLFPGHNHRYWWPDTLIITRVPARLIIKVTGHQLWWLVGGYDLK